MPSIGLVSTGSGVLSILWTILCLALVLGLAWLLSKWVKNTGLQRGAARHIRVLDQVAVGQDKALVLVSVGDKTLFVGMSAHAVQLLCEVDADTLQAPEQPAQAQSFASVLSALRRTDTQDGKGNGK